MMLDLFLKNYSKNVMNLLRQGTEQQRAKATPYQPSIQIDAIPITPLTHLSIRFQGFTTIAHKCLLRSVPA